MKRLRSTFLQGAVNNERPWVCSKKPAQQGRNHFSARSILVLREYGKMARTPLKAFFNSPKLVRNAGMNRQKLQNGFHGLMFATLSIICTLPAPTDGIASPPLTAGREVTIDEATEFIREAANATEQAWEEFHTSAIEGTLASPLVQVTIERQLHEARGLLMEARKAKRSQDYQSVQHITRLVQELTHHIILASRERKQ